VLLYQQKWDCQAWKQGNKERGMESSREVLITGLRSALQDQDAPGAPGVAPFPALFSCSGFSCQGCMSLCTETHPELPEFSPLLIPQHLWLQMPSSSMCLYLSLIWFLSIRPQGQWKEYPVYLLMVWEDSVAVYSEDETSASCLDVCDMEREI